MTQEHPSQTSPVAPTVASLQADIAALEFIFAELQRAMDPAALQKVLTYLIRNARREASENQTYDSVEHRRLVAQVERLQQQVAPEVKKQAMTQRNESNRLRKEKARHQADSRRQLQK